jgi:hypothetical protein
MLGFIQLHLFEERRLEHVSGEVSAEMALVKIKLPL